MCPATLFRTGRKRTGKIARLPDHLRAEVNRMLDDGHTYASIIHALGDHGKGMNHHSLKRWRQGGYQEHLKQQFDKETAPARAHFAQKVLEEKGTAGLAPALAAKFFDLVIDLDPSGIGPHLLSDADIYTRFLNSIVAASNATITASKYQLKNQTTAAALQSTTSPQDGPAKR